MELIGTGNYYSFYACTLQMAFTGLQKKEKSLDGGFRLRERILTAHVCNPKKIALDGMGLYLYFKSRGSCGGDSLYFRHGSSWYFALYYYRGA